jgi:hypothetical protein
MRILVRVLLRNAADDSMDEAPRIVQGAKNPSDIVPEEPG